jgi:hypothetical protein
MMSAKNLRNLARKIDVVGKKVCPKATFPITNLIETEMRRDKFRITQGRK